MTSYFTRSKALTDWKSAGLLPFAISGCEIVVLLGAERTRTGPKGKVWAYMWRDFGGGREAADADSAATAAREFAEETLGLFGGASVDEHSVHSSADSMAQRLRDPHKALRVVHQLKKGEYHMYVTQTWLMSPLMFRLATQQNEASRAVPGGEKSAFAWVPLADLLHAVRDARRRYLVTCRASISGGHGTPPPCGFGRRRFLLHPCFASSLRLAQAGGLMELLSHAEALPLPPAPPMPAPPLSLEGGESDGDCAGETKGPEGPTPEHMTYWLAQESVTLELRGGSGAGLGLLEVSGERAATAVVLPAAEAAAAVEGAAEPTPSHCSSSSVLAVGAAVSGVNTATQEGSSAVAGRAAARAAAAAAAAAATAAAVAAAVAAATPPPLAAAGGQAGPGGRACRHRSRKQRQLQRQRRRREQQRQQEAQQRANGKREGEGGRGLSSEPAHSGQSQQPQQQHWAYADRGDSAAGGGAWAEASSTEGLDPFGQQGADVGAGLGPPPPPPPLPPPLPALPPPAPPSSYWAVAQNGLSKLLGPHAAPRKRIKLD